MPLPLTKVVVVQNYRSKFYSAPLFLPIITCCPLNMMYLLKEPKNSGGSPLLVPI